VKEKRREVKLGGKYYSAASIIWKMMYDVDAIVVDHINNDPHDDRLINLRACTRSQNQANRRAKTRDLARGVYKLKGKYIASVKKDSKNIYLGLFNTSEDAETIAKTTAQELHREFSRY
jgi:HNH endonuclease